MKRVIINLILIISTSIAILSCSSNGDEIDTVDNPPCNICDYEGKWHSYSGFKDGNCKWIQYPASPTLSEETQHVEEIKKNISNSLGNLEISADPILTISTDCKIQYSNLFLLEYQYNFLDDCLTYESYLKNDSLNSYVLIGTSEVERHSEDIIDFNSNSSLFFENILIRIDDSTNLNLNESDCCSHCDIQGEWHSYEGYIDDNNTEIDYLHNIASLDELNENLAIIKQYLDSNISRLQLSADARIVFKDDCTVSTFGNTPSAFTLNFDCSNITRFSQTTRIDSFDLDVRAFDLITRRELYIRL